MTRTISLALLLGTALALGCNGEPELYINELMADNKSTLDADDGSYPDWIEIYNGSQKTINLNGIYITDDLTKPTKWELSGLTIDAGGFLTLYADDDEDLGANHLPFKLNKGGEELGLFRISEGMTIQLDAVSFDKQETDVATARKADGASKWTTTTDPTPGKSNN
ncbi:MAG: lamin tail domain-containing protein [Proteobacteria bacterium]|jgi:hypothetical protein|nr:lamin tail domain-containing protein [Pseudomonadota bacterium]